MALKLEDLKVGEFYADGTIIRKILCVGSERVFYVTEGGEGENTWAIENALAYWSLKPKPKKTIELVAYLYSNGFVGEYLKDSPDHKAMKERDLAIKISSRTLEIEE